MNRGDVSYCETTGKFCYSSEAKATRALHKYEEIKRVYLCEHCNHWHTTSMSATLAIKEGIIPKKSRRGKPSLKKIEGRLEKLKQRLKDQE